MAPIAPVVENAAEIFQKSTGLSFLSAHVKEHTLWTSTIQIDTSDIVLHQLGRLDSLCRVSRADLKDDSVLLDSMRIKDAFPVFFVKLDDAGKRVHGALAAHHGPVDNFRTPDEVRAVLQGEQSGR